jgi:hypothetical protein
LRSLRKSARETVLPLLLVALDLREDLRRLLLATSALLAAASLWSLLSQVAYRAQSRRLRGGGGSQLWAACKCLSRLAGL